VRYLLLIFGLLAAGTVSAQVADIQLGTSTLMGTGGGVVLYGPNSVTTASVGSYQGHLTFGLSENFEFKKWDIFVGSKQFSITSGQLSLTVPEVGLAVTRKMNKGELELFIGGVGDVYSAPYYFGVHDMNFGMGMSYRRSLNKYFTVGTIQGFAGERKTSLGEALYKRNHFQVHGQAGMLQNNPQWGGDAQLNVHHLGASVARNTYIFDQPCKDCPPILATHASVNSGSIFGGSEHVFGNASVYESNLNHGQSAGVGTQFGWLSTTASLYNSPGQRSLMLSVSEHGLHWSLTQYATQANGSWSYNFGGSYQTNRLSASVGYQMLFFPLLAQPFQKTLYAQVSVHIRALNVNYGNIILPNGKTQWSLYGDQFAQTRLRLPSIGNGELSAHRDVYGRSGKYILEGVVVNQKGEAVEGACIVIGKNDAVFTDSQGHWSVRERKSAAVSVKVDVDQFMTGDYQVVEAPATATPGTPVKIIVRTKQ
jgi:hypothetical protein